MYKAVNDPPTKRENDTNVQGLTFLKAAREAVIFKTQRENA